MDGGVLPGDGGVTAPRSTAPRSRKGTREGTGGTGGRASQSLRLRGAVCHSSSSTAPLGRLSGPLPCPLSLARRCAPVVRPCSPGCLVKPKPATRKGFGQISLLTLSNLDSQQSCLLSTFSLCTSSHSRVSRRSIPLPLWRGAPSLTAAGCRDGGGGGGGGAGCGREPGGPVGRDAAQGRGAGGALGDPRRAPTGVLLSLSLSLLLLQQAIRDVLLQAPRRPSKHPAASESIAVPRIPRHGAVP